MEEAPVPLFCLPHAGGAGAVFRPWQRHPDLPVRVRPVDLPGHGTRRGEPLLTAVGPLVADLTERITGLTQGGRYLLYGHSFGALLAWELAHALRDTAAGPPAALLVSGRNGPSVPHPAPPLHALPRERLIERLVELDGIPQVIRGETELIDLFLPALRADARMAECYERGDRGLLDCPIRAVAGDADPLADVPGLHRWAEETTADCTVTTVRAGHMLLDAPEFLRWLCQSVEKAVAG